MEVAYKVEFLIDPLLVGGDVSNSLSISFDSIMEDIRNIKIDDILKLFDDKRQGSEVKKKVAEKSNDAESQSRVLMTDEVVGFDAETRSIINRLTRGSKRLQMVAIVGMPGLGKTTLATKVYNDPSIIVHFHVRAWCSVSQLFDRKRVLLEILSHIVPSKYQEMAEQGLAEKLPRLLKERRYLICLDDLWDIEAWKKLEGIFPNDSNGSRILLTSRVRDVVLQAILDEEPLFLNHLNVDKSWELLNTKLFGKKGWPLELNLNNGKTN